MINTKIISELNPCTNRFDNWKKHYDTKTLSKPMSYAQFLGLRNITQHDKIWVCFRLMDKDLLRFAAADIAELVLPIYEKAYPNDLRPRQAIEAARAVPFDRGKARAATNAANAATYAAYAANAAASDAATNATTNATTNAASVAAYAANAAAYAAASDAAYAASVASAAYAATMAASDAGEDRSKIEKKIRTIVLKYLNKGKKKRNK